MFALLNFDDFLTTTRYYIACLTCVLLMFRLRKRKMYKNKYKKLFRCKAHVSDQCFLLYCVYNLCERAFGHTSVQWLMSVSGWQILRCYVTDGINVVENCSLTGISSKMRYTFSSHLSAWLTNNIDIGEANRVTHLNRFCQDKSIVNVSKSSKLFSEKGHSWINKESETLLLY